MSDRKTPNGTANKVAMSRALGAAFLNHQVEQLEKSVSSNGPASGNWRDRKYPGNSFPPLSPGGAKRGPNSPGIKVAAQRKKAGGEVQAVAGRERQVVKDKDFDRGVTSSQSARRRSAEEEKTDKDADVVVVDASVLIHALYQVKRWCRDGREEVVIVPLEALNTLDLLKKGTSSLAQRARAASRILEAQVGTNPRIRVQRDDAFVLWDKIPFDNNGDGETKNLNSCPEWVRRIVCCARWATEHPEEELQTNARRSVDGATADKKPLANPENQKPPKVVLAVLSSAPNLSPQTVLAKLADMSIAAEAPLAPVPLPAPTLPHANKYEARSVGTLVTSWATQANIKLLEIDPALPGREEEDRPKRAHHNARGRRPSGSDHGAKSGLVERPPAVMAMMEMISQPSKVVRVLARGEKLDADP
ncbi:hypothetical protein B0H34DRAFT_677853 [Crassisporium funariophilum]|nr:hypothetical protein B0H34DRAFT_677853 [Crassisporium funariophilum]